MERKRKGNNRGRERQLYTTDKKKNMHGKGKRERNYRKENMREIKEKNVKVKKIWKEKQVKLYKQKKNIKMERKIFIKEK